MSMNLPRAILAILMTALLSACAVHRKPAAWIFTSEACETAIWSDPDTLSYRQGTIVQGVDRDGHKTSDWYCEPRPLDVGTGHV